MLKILEEREERALYQNELLAKHQKRLVVIKANYPGADKNNIYVSYLVFKAYLEIKDKFNIIATESTLTLEGLIIYLVVEDELIFVKEQAILLENQNYGRLLDIDVYDCEKQISRQDLGYEARRCFLCDNQAIICVRSQKHSIEEIKTYFKKIVIEDIFSGEIDSNLVIFGLINELCKMSCLGTVGINFNGNHLDMDKMTFFNSIEAISKQFKKFNEIDTKEFANLRAFGVEVEKAMFKATNNINTHKGAIFSLIIYLAAIKNVSDYYLISEEVKRLSKDLESDFVNEDIDTTFTKDLYHQCKITGIRGFAMSGFKNLFDVFAPFYQASEDLELTYLLIIFSLEDTTIIKRGGLEKLEKLQKLANGVIKGEIDICIIEDFTKEHNLSCGGSADILALVLINDLVKKYYFNEKTKKK